jgi:hypothetical protein
MVAEDNRGCLEGNRLLNLELGAALEVTFSFLLNYYINYITLTPSCVSVNKGTR